MSNKVLQGNEAEKAMQTAMISKDQDMGTAVTPVNGAKYSNGTNLNLGTTEAIYDIPYDTEIQKRVFKKAPFYSFCEQIGILKPTDSPIVGYRYKEQKTTSTFIDEDGEIPAHNQSLYGKEEAKMKTLVYPIKISDLVMRGDRAAAVNILEDEINDAIKDLAAAKDTALLEADGTNKKVQGLFPSIKTNKFDAKGETITKDLLDDACQAAIDNGGSPSAIITTTEVGKQLNNLLYPTIRNVNTISLPLGYNVVSYVTPDQQQIPIITDPNISSTGGEKLAFLDDDSFQIRELVKQETFPLAVTNLAISTVVYSYITSYNRAEYQNSIITGIGKRADQ